MQTFYTPAELKILREQCGITRDELAAKIEVQVRTIKHWERPKGRVPSEVGDMLHGLLVKISDLTKKLAALNSKVIPLVREIDQGHKFHDGYDFATWSNAVGRLFTMHPETRIVWVGMKDYEAHLNASGKSHSLAEMASFAEHQVELQALPHSSDQPPIELDCIQSRRKQNFGLSYR